MDEKNLQINSNSMDIESLVQLVQSNDANANKYALHLDDTQEKIKDLAKQSSVTMHDHFNNPVTSEGDDNVLESFTSYGYSNDTLNWTLWLALYNDSWVFRRAIDKPAQDEIKCGFTLHGDNDYDNVYRLYNRYKSDLTQLLMWGALFGGSVGVIQFEGFSEEDMAKPLDKNKIKGKKFKLYVTDRWYGGYARTDKMVNNMKDIDYGKPAYYEITFPDGHSYVVHHSYVLRYEHRVAPPLIKNGQLQGWGYAEGAHILNELSRDDQLKSSITSLVNKSLIEVVQMAGMRGVFMGTDKGNEAQLRKRLEMVNWARNYNSITLLDKDDTYQQFQLSALGGLADLMEKNMWLISSAMEMQGVLFGELKGGLSQDTDAYEHYSDTIDDRCNTFYRPVLNKFLKIIFLVLDIDDPVDFDFNPLARDTKNKERIDSINNLSGMLDKLNSSGIISKYQYAVSMQNYMTRGSIDLNISDEYLNKLKLEEEQEILDSLEELSKKGRNIPKPNFEGMSSTPNMAGSSEPSDIGGDDIESSETTESIPETTEATTSGEPLNTGENNGESEPTL